MIQIAELRSVRIAGIMNPILRIEELSAINWHELVKCIHYSEPEPNQRLVPKRIQRNEKKNRFYPESRTIVHIFSEWT